MFPQIISSLLSRDGKNSNVLFPFKLAVIIFLAMALFVPWIIGKVINGKKDYSFINQRISQVLAAKSGCWSDVGVPEPPSEDVVAGACGACATCTGCGGCMGSCGTCACTGAVAGACY